MKKTICLLLALLLFASLLSACGNGGGTTEGEGTKPVESQETGDTKTDPSETQPADTGDVFKVGYARENITPEPDEQLPLGGYGNTDKRLSTGFLDFLYMTCIAFRDAEGNTLLWFTEDLMNANTDLTPKMKQHVSEITGVDTDHILATGTHTHSAPDQSQTKMEALNRYLDRLVDAAGKAAAAAVADLAPATFQWGSADLTGYNYVRHYFNAAGESKGDNHGHFIADSDLVKHTTEANSEMSILEIQRDGAKDILLTTWRAHATITGGQTKYNISADFIGAVRAEIEKRTDYLFAYYQGEAGNMNPRTRLPESVEFNPPKDVKEYGKQVTDLILKGLEEKGTVPVKTGTIQTINTTFTGKINHDWDELVSIADTLRSQWNKNGNFDYEGAAKYTIIDSLGNLHHIESPYQASAIVSHAGMGKEATVEIHATRMGEFAFVNAPFEVFDTNGTYIKENSPSKYTMVIGYSNQGQGYLPSQYAYEYGCYESDTTKFQPGTAEQLAEKYVELLKELFQ